MICCSGFSLTNANGNVFGKKTRVQDHAALHELYSVFVIDVIGGVLMAVTFSFQQKAGEQVGTHFLQNSAERAECSRPLRGQMVQEYLRPLLAGLMSQYLLVLPQREHLVVDQVGEHGVDVQLVQDLLSVLFEDLICPPLLLPGAWPPASPLLLPLLLLHEPLLGATAEHLQAEETHQDFFHGSVNTGPKGGEVHISCQCSDHATYFLESHVVFV